MFFFWTPAISISHISPSISYCVCHGEPALFKKAPLCVFGGSRCCIIQPWQRWFICFPFIIRNLCSPFLNFSLSPLFWIFTLLFLLTKPYFFNAARPRLFCFNVMSSWILCNTVGTKEFPSPFIFPAFLSSFQFRHLHLRSLSPLLPGSSL